MNNVPPGYKQTEVGVIPEEWDVLPLSLITDPKRPIGYGIVQTGRRISNGVKCVRVVDFENGQINSDDLITTSPEISAAYKRTLLAEGDLLIALRGKIGELAVIGKELIGANLTRGVALLAPLSGYDSKYLSHYLSSPRGKQVFERNLNGSALQEIPIATLRKIPAVVPPLPEQRAIATALCDVDALLGALDRLIAKKRDLKQAAMQQLLTGQTRLPGFHGEWEVKQLEQSCELITKGTTPTSIGRDFTEGGVNFLKAESISESGEPLVDKVAFIDAATNILLKRSQLKEGDLLISIAGVLGRVGRVSKEILPANTNQALALIRLANASELERDFLFYCLRSPMTTKQISDVNVQAAQANISLQNVRDLEIRVPPTKTEQTAIAAVLTDMDAELTALEQRREKTRALKQGMMQELLTGRIRLVEPRRTARGAAC